MYLMLNKDVQNINTVQCVMYKSIGINYTSSEIIAVQISGNIEINENFGLYIII